MSRLSIIWDMTPVCPFNCPICCMGAKTNCSNAAAEIEYGLKYAIVGQLLQLAAERDIKIDLSGGEIMTDLRNLNIATEISKIIGKDNIGISTSGYGIDADIAARLAFIIGEIELTMDTPPGVPYRLRPLEYAKSAARAVPLLKAQGIYTGIQTVLARSNCNKENLSALYRWLCQNHVDEWSLLRFYPSGRGADFPEECLNDTELLQIVHFIQTLDAQNMSTEKPRLHFHYTIKGHSGYTTQCRCVKKSIGIFPDGDVTACFWASDRESHIAKEFFRLGNIKTETLAEILRNPRSCYWQNASHTCPLMTTEKEDQHVSHTQRYDRSA